MELNMQDAAFTPPSWMTPYKEGSRVGYSQAVMAYADYYNLDGSADLEPECEERLPVHRREMVSYASRTGTKQNLAAMREAGWRLLVSPTGVLRTEDFRYCLDNGAWTAFQQGRPFDERAFGRAIDLLGEGSDFFILPDIVAGGMRSLEFSLKWKVRLSGIPTLTLLAVQDGMEPDDVREYLNPACGIFLGGSTEYQEVGNGQRMGCPGKTKELLLPHWPGEQRETNPPLRSRGRAFVRWHQCYPFLQNVAQT